MIPNTNYQSISPISLFVSEEIGQALHNLAIPFIRPIDYMVENSIRDFTFLSEILGFRIAQKNAGHVSTTQTLFPFSFLPTTLTMFLPLKSK